MAGRRSRLSGSARNTAAPFELLSGSSEVVDAGTTKDLPGVEQVVRSASQSDALDGVLPTACFGSSWVDISIEYDAPPTTLDVNANGVPDECDLTRGDNNLDGVVNVTDLPSSQTRQGKAVAPASPSAQRWKRSKAKKRPEPMSATAKCTIHTWLVAQAESSIPGAESSVPGAETSAPEGGAAPKEVRKNVTW